MFPRSIIIDLETTDASLTMARGQFPEVVEIGALRCGPDLEILEEYSQVVRPQIIDDYSEYCEKFTGIKLAEIEAAPQFREIWKKFAEFTRYNATPLISWGMSNDYPILRNEYSRARTGWPHSQPVFDAISICFAYSLQWGFRVPRWSLKAACDRFDINPEESHRALSGAHRCRSVLLALIDYENLEDEDWMKVR